MRLFNTPLEDTEEEIAPETNHENHIDDLISKLCNIIDTFSSEKNTRKYVYVSIYKHKTLTLKRRKYTYASPSYYIYISDICIYDINDWSDDIPEECKQKVIKTIDKLYNDALEKQKQDEQDKLDKIKRGCSEL